MDFLNNDTAPPALTIAALFKCRWQVGLYCQRNQQDLHIKQFLAACENEVTIQVGCAVAACMRIATIKAHQIDASRYIGPQILSVLFFEKVQLSCALQFDA